MRRTSLLAAAGVFLCTIAAAEPQSPTVSITALPTFGVRGFMQGIVTGVEPSEHVVATYIHVEGSGWWSKPSAAIAADGTFTADVATGGIDEYATVYCAALVPKGVTPPVVLGGHGLPSSLQPEALDCDERYGRTLLFAGRQWAVKEAPAPVGPGANRFSSRAADVYVDEAGRLHLTIRFHDGFWWATELILLEHLGFGTYAVETETPPASLDANATFGAFTWDAYGDDDRSGADLHREIDLEDSRWGNANAAFTSQFARQPSAVAGNLRRYAVAAELASLTRMFTWSEHRIDFVAVAGHHPATEIPPGEILENFDYDHDPAREHFVPIPGRERFRLNLWLNDVELGGAPPPAPAAGLPVEVIVDAFRFMPGCSADGDCDDANACTADRCGERGCVHERVTGDACLACGRPLSGGSRPLASDCLFALRTAVGADSCALCVCDVDASGSVLASDALCCLRNAVGGACELRCPPCGAALQ